MIDMPTLSDYISLKRRIEKLEKRNNYLAHRVSVLSKKLGINKGSKKAEIMRMLESGESPSAIKNAVKCSLSLVYEYRAEYENAINKDEK